MSLGGVRDEAEIRGHRRTYIGSMPGKIVQNMVAHRRPQPAVPARRSRQDGDGFPRRPVVGAARSARPRAELDVQRSLPRGRFRPVRGDVRLHGEQPEHPGAAARPHGSDPAARLHRGREGEHRAPLPAAEADQAERPEGRASSRSPTPRSSTSSATTRAKRASAISSARLSKICRKSVKELLLETERKSITVTPKNLPKYLGVRRFRYGRAEENDQVGQVTGLAWTEVGGELLTIEAAVMPGKGKLTHTGQLGEVMQESIQAAMTVVRSRATRARPRAGVLSEGRRAHSRARGRDAEGRPERRHRHVHGAGLGADARSRCAATSR